MSKAERKKVKSFQKRKKYCSLLRLLVIILITILLTAFYFIALQNCNSDIRLDQYASTITSSLIGVIVTMFGLTAASYAFVWGELKNEEEINIRLKQILDDFRQEIWEIFFNTLMLSLLIIIVDIIILGAIQLITDTTLYLSEPYVEEGRYFVKNYYSNNNFIILSTAVFSSIILSVCDVVLMGKLNYMIFNRKDAYEKIAHKMLNELKECYDLSIDGKELPESLRDDELSKIHYLELLVNRLIKNHETERDSSSYISREDELLRQIISSKLKSCDLNWEHLSEEKRKSLAQQCKERAGFEVGSLSENTLEFNKPSKKGFIEVYDDMITYRNARIVLDASKKDKIKAGDIKGVMLKRSIKKRLLILLMSHERFDGMDLANMSLSGADISFSNFSNCNLKGVKLKGANCCGTDFSGSRMPGIHFDIELETEKKQNAHNDDIVITCNDDKDTKWDVYNGQQPTCLVGASFARADVSRMTLIMNVEADKTAGFPFMEKKIPVSDKCLPFNLSEVNFDGAKLINSSFNYIDLSRSSIFQAQMFNSRLELVDLENVNLGETVLTYSRITYSSFCNSNLKGTVLSDCNIGYSGFNGANLSEANLSNTLLNNCSFTSAICNNTSFKNIRCNDICKLFDDKVSFEYATMRSADFSNAILKKCDFSHANVLGGIFTKSVVTDGKFISSILSSTIWNSTEITNTMFKDTVMRDSIFICVKFVDCTFIGCDFSNSVIDCSFENCIVENVKFRNIEKMDLRNFRKSMFNKVDFTGSGLRDSDFSDSNELTDCVFDINDSAKGEHDHRYYKRKKKHEKIPQRRNRH